MRDRVGVPSVVPYFFVGALLGAVLGFAGWELLPREEPSIGRRGGEHLLQGSGGHVARCTVAFGMAGAFLHPILHEDREYRLFFYLGFALCTTMGILLLFPTLL